VTAGRFRHVLVGWDASADAAEALSAAASIAGDEGHVVALSVVPENSHVEAADERDRERAAARRWAEEQFERARQVVASASGARMSLEIVESPQVARVVCDYAAEHGFDLLVLGRHGDIGTLRRRPGRVAEAAAWGSAIPVLLLSAR
jgi:nucleotide-binding universal stress UspA family protein